MPSEKEDARTAKVEKGLPWFLIAVAWLVPGLGHLLLGKKIRAGVFAAVIVAAFVTGILLEGELAVPHRGQPFSWLASAACFGSGGLYILGKIFGLGGGDPQAVGFAFGNTFLYTAGLMNLLTVLDTSDIWRGEKD
ncbi:MAG: hypothetical protein GY906_13325 [bacterium]|nr:hypothetical protein [bacterium]